MSTFAKIVTGLAIFALVRVTLVDNPWVWHAYGRALEPNAIGWRQYGALRKRIASYEPPPPPVRYLAVGSSQTGAVYYPYAGEHSDLVVFDVAAMGPFDFVTHLEQIERYRPETILLYLSDFDIGRQPAREALVLAPQQGLRSPALWRDLLAVPSGWDTGPLLAEMVLGEVIPEFKYRFVFRGLVDEVFRRVAIRVGTRPPNRPREPLDDRIRILRESIDTDHASFNLYFLSRFLEATEELGVSVVMVEGQYNPLVVTDELLGVQTWVRGELTRVARDFDHVRFLRRGQIPEFGVDDFLDLTHLTPEAGLRLAESVFSQLEADSPSGGADTGTRTTEYTGLRRPGFQ